MQSQVDRKAVRRRIRHRIRKKVQGTADRPRLAVFRSAEAHLRAGDRRRAGTDPGHRLDAGRAGAWAEAGRAATIEAAKQVGAGDRRAS